MNVIMRLTKNFILFFFIAQIYIFLSNYHLLILASHTPQGARFTWNHIAYWSMDHNVYLSVINQGARGEWLMRDAYTAEPTHPTFFYFFYILLGKISGALNILPDTAYLWAKLIGVEFFVLSLYFLSKKILGKNGIWASLLALSISALPVLNWDTRYYHEFWPWWARFDAILRLDNMPHYLWSWGLLCLFAATWFSYMKGKKTYLLVLSSIFSLLSSMFLPSSAIPIIAGLGVLWLLSKKHRTGTAFFVAAIVAIPLLLTYREKFNGFPWTEWYLFELDTWNRQATHFNIEFLLSAGLLPILALVGIRKNNPSSIFLAVWAFLPFFLLPFSSLLGLSKYRLASTGVFIPFALLSIQAIQYFKKTGVLLICISIAFSIITSLYIFTNLNRTAQEYPVYANVYIPKEMMDIFSYLNTNADATDVIVSDWVSGNLFPVFTPVTAFTGHPVHTRNFFDKTAWYGSLYRGELTQKDAETKLGEYRITYILHGPAEKRIGVSLSAYTFLKKVYVMGDYKLYKVEL